MNNNCKHHLTIIEQRIYNLHHAQESDLKDILVDFSLSCMMQNPHYLKTYASSYFTEQVHHQEVLEEEIEEMIMREKTLEQIEHEVLKEVEMEEYAESEELPTYASSNFLPQPSVAVVHYNISEEQIPVHIKSVEERKSIEDSIDAWPTFMCLSQEQKEQLINAVTLENVSKGTVIIKQGSVGDNFYIVAKGLYDLYASWHQNDEPEKLYTFENRGCFGELALTYDMPRGATIRAVTRGSLWVLDYHSFQKILARTLYLKREYHKEVVQAVPFFENLTFYHRIIICDALKTKRYNPGDIIFKQGAKVDGIYFIRSGQVASTMFNKATNKDVVIAQYYPGDYFGELGLITNRCRLLTCIATELTTVSFMLENYYMSVLDPYWSPELRLKIPEYEAVVMRKMGTTLDKIYANLSNM